MPGLGAGRALAAGRLAGPARRRRRPQRVPARSSAGAPRWTGGIPGSGSAGRAGCFEALVPAVLEQKVVGAEARRAWRLLLLRFGDRPPGPAPAGMRVFPPARAWAMIPSWEWHRAGVEGVRAKTIVGAARVAARLEEIVAMSPAEADLRLRSLPGIGPWTSAEVRQRACGDADAVSVGDYHLPGMVGWALAGRKVDDAGMLELLAPFPGHRHRVARLVDAQRAADRRAGARACPSATTAGSDGPAVRPRGTRPGPVPPIRPWPRPRPAPARSSGGPAAACPAARDGAARRTRNRCRVGRP